MPTTDAPGFPVHFEDLGHGAPTVFLHGGLESSDDHAALLASLAEQRRVVAPDRRGHGRTGDVAGPYSYRAMVEETAAVLDAIGLGPADVVGFSDGGNIALELARRRPDLVRSIVAISANLDADGLEPAMRERLASLAPDSPALEPMRAAHAALSPDGPQGWSSFHRKVCAMGAAGPGLTLQDMAAITCPVLLVYADDDVIRLEHSVAIFRALPDAQLAVVPGTSHLLLHEKPATVLAAVRDFLHAPQPRRLLPIRR